GFFVRTEDRNGIEVAFQGRAGEGLKSCLAAKDARRPGQPGIIFPQKTESTASHRAWHIPTQPILVTIKIVATVSGKVLVSAIPTQGYRHMLTCHRRDVVGRNCRGVGERLVKMPSQLVHDLDGA